MDPKEGSNSDRPPRRTALVAAELRRYNIDIAAISETRLPGEDSLTEMGEGYTFIWKGLSPDAPRFHGVGFAIKSDLLRRLPETPVGISERLMTLRIPLASKRYATIISAYAPTLMAEEDVKDAFYDLLDQTLSHIHRSDKILLLGDFNARVGSNYAVWNGIIGKHGVGKANSNGTRLLNICSTHDLVVTNTLFQLPNKFKTSWKHPRSGHWHLLDYVITRQSDRQDVSICRVMRGADCWTDHRLIRAIIRMQIRPVTRKKAGQARLNCRALKDPDKCLALECRLKEEAALSTSINTSSDTSSPCTLSEEWDHIASTLLNSTKEVVGLSKKRHQDWFDDNSVSIHELLRKKRSAHEAVIRNPTSQPLRAQYAKARSDIQKNIRAMKNRWWQEKAAEIQSLADKKDIHGFYKAVKQVYGPPRNTSNPLRSADGSTLLKDKQAILTRWAEHFSELLNRKNPTDPSILDQLPTLPPIPQLAETPSFHEVCMKRRRRRRPLKFCMRGRVREVVIYFKFHKNRSRGLRAVEGRNRPLPLKRPMAYTTACTTVQAVII